MLRRARGVLARVGGEVGGDMNNTTDRQPTTDEQAGMDWWNSLTETERAHWLAVSQTAVPAEAWAAFKAAFREA